METFLELLEIELKSLDQEDFYEPEAEIEPDDHIVGDMSENALRLFTVWRRAAKSTAEKMTEAKFERNPDLKSQLEVQVHELHSKADFLRDLFWIEVKDEHKLWGKDSVGVRKGRLVTWSEEKKHINLGDLLRSIDKGS